MRNYIVLCAFPWDGGGGAGKERDERKEDNGVGCRYEESIHKVTATSLILEMRLHAYSVGRNK